MSDASSSPSEDPVEDTQGRTDSEHPTAEPPESGQETGEVRAATEAETDATGSADSSAEAPTQSRLEEEGDIAADYVEELLDISDIDGDIDIEVRNGRTYVSVIAEGDDERLRDLVGQDGKRLEALQELARLAVLSATGNRSRLVLDIAGHRTERANELEVVAQEAVDAVRQTGEPVHLRPMGAYERKIVHDVIAEAGLVSESEGEGPRRHVVVSSGD
ncbi:protein jag [Citricoccus sp. GCM10030269]|uniref:Jag family protein n=1 Tax=Citricoccus sp. GCM10030269 TaxID=3273388 RepID=UPI0036088573